MRHNKLKKLALLAVVLCITSIPVVTYANDSKTNGGIIEQSNIEINDNWLTREVASQLNKKVRNLTEQDFLNIKKIDLRYEKIDNNIPEEIKLLKNLEYLNVNTAKIDGQVPESLGELPKLTYLDLGDNQIRELPDSVKQKIINGNYSYCDVEGNKFRLDEGWYFLKGKWCYLDRNGYRIEGSKTINGKEYEFNEDGNVREGWESDKDKNWYYYDRANGLVKNDWKQVSGKWYYFNGEGVMQKGLQTIKNIKFYLNESGAMVTGWQKIDNNYYYFSITGGMQYGWLNLDDKIYYFEQSTGVMVSGEKTIDGEKYKFSSDGSLIKNAWIDNYTYVQANGKTVNTYYNYSHSNTNYQLFKYMTNINNQMSVDSTAIWLHGGNTSNNCVYFASEALRRVGVNIPNVVANTYQFENELKSWGFVSSYDFSQLKPGDIIFTNNYSHVYIFMCWDRDGYAYIVDNQGTSYGNLVLHRRQVLQDTSISDRATHFFYYPK
ncbi:MAG: cell wall-binding protein [Clostridium sp.]|uniref:cell wall-binding protein n=1 Tax=Clostridium sp. TaxID=1506 RepID=UPI0025C0F8A9|nr:cell wall-binding protein [Clostridium sp.]MCE5220562.1 cell wall-binding protein [Clostridium sp.]